MPMHYKVEGGGQVGKGNYSRVTGGFNGWQLFISIEVRQEIFDN